MKNIATTLSLGLLVNTAYAQSAPAPTVKYSAAIDIAPVTEQIPTVQPGQTMQYIVDPKTEPVVPVHNYQAQVWLTPYATLANTADDTLVQYIPVQLTGPNPVLTVEGEHQRTMVAPTTPGLYALYTEFKADEHVADTRSYHRFIVKAPEAPVEIPFVPDRSEVEAWLAAGIEFTEGGITEPRWNDTFVPDQQIIQYEAGKSSGAHFAVLGTEGYVGGVRVETDPCKPVDPCVAPLREELYVVGATLDGKIIHTSLVDTSVTPIQPGQELVARYDGENLNMRTHLIEGVSASDEARITSLEQRLAGHTVLPNMGNVFAVEAILYGTVGIDANHDGRITQDEQHCEPIAWKTQYVQTVPKGHEGAAFIGGLVLGAVGGYLIPYGSPEDSHEGRPVFPTIPEQGKYQSGTQGNTVQ